MKTNHSTAENTKNAGRGGSMKSLPKIKPKRIRRFRRSIPNQDGWWRWRESGLKRSDSERLLIAVCGRHAEVATDGALAHVTGRDYPPENEGEGFTDNYWEMTDCKSMGGLWMLETPMDLEGIN